MATSIGTAITVVQRHISEDELITQFGTLIDTLDLNAAGIREKLSSEVARYKKFQQAVLGTRVKADVSDVETREYAKYLLREGSILEKRELLGLLKGKVLLNQKRLSLVDF
jgi:hypothetical protein